MAAISSQTERIEMEEGRDQNKKHGGGYNAVIQSSGIPNDEKRLEEPEEPLEQFK